MSSKRRDDPRQTWPGLVFGAGLLVLAAPAARPAPARAEGGGRGLTLRAAVRRAVARSPVVRAAGHNAAAAHARARQASTGWLPRVRLEGGYQIVGPVPHLSITQQVDPMPEPITIERDVGSLHNAQVGLTVAWRAWDFGARDVLARAARAQAEAARAEGAERAAQVAFATRAAYLAVLFFEEMDRVTARALASARQELREEQVKKRAGVGSDLGIARIQSRIADLEARQARARQEQARARDTLRLLLGLPAGAPLRLADSLEALASAPLPGLEASARTHPALARLDALERAARLQYRQQFWRYFPTLDVVGQIKYQYPKTFFETDQAGFAYMAGVMLTWNVFDGDLLRRQRAETRARMRQVSSLDQATREEVRRKVADARARVRIARAAAASARKMARSAEVYLRAARVARKAGTGTALEVRKAEEALDGARLALAKAWFDGALARAQLLRALGQVDTRAGAATGR